MGNEQRRSLLGKLGLSVGLAFLLVLGHLLWHGPSNGFLQLLQRLLQSAPLERAQNILKLHVAGTPKSSQFQPPSRATAPHGGHSLSGDNSHAVPAHTHTGLAGLWPHLLVEVEPAGSLEQGVLAAGEEGGQVSVDPRAYLAAQLTRLQLDAAGTNTASATTATEPERPQGSWGQGHGDKGQNCVKVLWILESRDFIPSCALNLVWE